MAELHEEEMMVTTEPKAGREAEAARVRREQRQTQVYDDLTTLQMAHANQTGRFADKEQLQVWHDELTRPQRPTGGKASGR